MAIVQTCAGNLWENTLGKRTESLCSLVRPTGRPLDKNPLSKSNRILTHVIDLVNATYVK